MSLLAATWTGASASVGLFIGAIVTAVYAIKAFRKQSEEVRLLQEQARRDIEQRRRAQASQVFITVGRRPFEGNPEDMRAAACIHNTSAQPIYDIVLGLGETGDQRWPVLLPRSELVRHGLGTDFAKRHSRSSARNPAAAMGCSRERPWPASGRVSGCGRRSGSDLPQAAGPG
jgi:hypothetical protein